MRPTCLTWAAGRPRSEKPKIIAMDVMDSVIKRVCLGLQESADLRNRICLMMAFFIDSDNAYDLVLMDGVTKKYSCNHFKLTLLLRPNDLQEDSYCYIEKMSPPGFREAM